MMLRGLVRGRIFSRVLAAEWRQLLLLYHILLFVDASERWSGIASPGCV